MRNKKGCLRPESCIYEFLCQDYRPEYCQWNKKAYKRLKKYWGKKQTTDFLHRLYELEKYEESHAKV